MVTDGARTLIEALATRLRACRGTEDGSTAPAAILWTDPEGHWVPILASLRAALPELVELGAYSPAERRGPAIWLRCVVDRTVSVPGLPSDRPPILYLPGVGRQDLRAGEDTRVALQPLVELLFRGALCLQRGGHDWTVSAFLSSPEALGLDLARDRETTEALLRALPDLAHAPLSELRDRRLDAADFHRMLSADPVRDLLRWMGAPTETRGRMRPQDWAAFRGLVVKRFGFDPETEDATVAGEKLGTGARGWDELWKRFSEAPPAFPGIAELLVRSKPTGLIFDKERWPDENEAGEAELRTVLGDLHGVPQGEACEAVLDLEREHAPRRGWVWARLGRAPMARVLEPLAVLAREARSALGGSTPDEIARAYDEHGWRADGAAWQAFAAAEVRDEDLVAEVVQALLEPWLELGAVAFQRAIEARALPGRGALEAIDVDVGGLILFVDGLRYDVARELVVRLESRGMRVNLKQRWAALPTVTATAKPAVSPVADEIVGANLPADFAPKASADGRAVQAASLRALMERRGYQLVEGGPSDWPVSDAARGWCETGKLDERGHQLHRALAREIEPEIARIVERVVVLFDAGWKTIRIVTDHGWLWLPGGLPKAELPKHLTASRWARCAAIAGNADVAVPTFAWHWNAAQRFATPSGIGCFNQELEYAHGGVSIQECLIPDLRIERGGERPARASIRSIRWQGMRCFVKADVASGDVSAQLRLERPNGKSISKARSVADGGESSLLLDDDAHERAELVLVLLAADGTVLAQRKTKVGMNA